MSVTLAVLAVVAVLVFWYFYYCWRSVRSSEASAHLARLWDPLKDDVTHRLASGRDPDWTHYLEEASRKHEDLREQLRNFGTISLATGVGGTMLALALYLLTSNGDVASDGASQLSTMLVEMGWALIASFTGVLGNWTILFVLLPSANRRFNPQLDEFLDELRTVERNERKQLVAGPSTDGSVGSQIDEQVLSAMAQLPGALEKVGNAADVFSSATATLHKDADSLASASADLTQAVGDLRQVPEELDAGVGKTLKDVLAKANAFEKSILEATTLQEKMTERFGRTGSKIVTVLDVLPEHLGAALEDSGEAMRRKLTKALEPQLAGFQEAFSEAASTGERVATAMTNLPLHMADAIDKSGESFQRRFGDALERHLVQFRDGLTGGLDKVVEWQDTMHQQLEETRRAHKSAIHELKNSMLDVRTSVGQLPRELTEGIEKVSKRLGREFGREAREHVEDLRESLLKHVTQLREELARHESHLLNTTVAELKKVSEQLIETLVEDLGKIVDSCNTLLKRFPDHADAATATLEIIEGKLVAIVGQIEANQFALRTVHKETNDRLAGVGASTKGLDNTIQELTRILTPLWKRCWLTLRRLFQSNDGAKKDESTGQGPHFNAAGQLDDDKAAHQKSKRRLNAGEQVQADGVSQLDSGRRAD